MAEADRMADNIGEGQMDLDEDVGVAHHAGSQQKTLKQVRFAQQDHEIDQEEADIVTDIYCIKNKEARQGEGALKDAEEVNDDPEEDEGLDYQSEDDEEDLGLGEEGEDEMLEEEGELD